MIKRLHHITLLTDEIDRMRHAIMTNTPINVLGHFGFIIELKEYPFLQNTGMVQVTLRHTGHQICTCRAIVQWESE